MEALSVHLRALVERAHSTGAVIVPNNTTIVDDTVTQTGRVVKSRFYPLIVTARDNKNPKVPEELKCKLASYLRRSASDLRISDNHVVNTTILSALATINMAGAKGVHLSSLRHKHSHDDLLSLEQNNFIYIVPQTDIAFSRAVAQPYTGAAPLFLASVLAGPFGKVNQETAETIPQDAGHQ